METASVRSRVCAAFLRQLWFGLATYRLYPDSPERSGFQTAAGLIQGAARPVLQAEPFEIEIHQNGFAAQGVALPADPALVRLARSCFERRAEMLRLIAIPTVPELNALFAALTTPVDELDRTGGLEPRLREVTSLALLRLGPKGRPGGGGLVPVEGTDPAIDIPGSTSAFLGSLTDGLSGTVGDQAEQVLERLRAAVSPNDPRSSSAADQYFELCGALAIFPEELRRAVIGKLIGQGAGDLLAERLIGSLSNAELSRAIVGLGGEGHEPIEIAQRLADAGVRKPDIVDFTAALQAGFEDGATILAGLEQIGSPIRGLDPGSSVADALGEHLLVSEPGDLQALRELSIAGEEQGTALGLATLQDYLFLEREPEQFELVAQVWAETTRHALLRRDLLGVMELVSTVEASRDPRSGRSFLETHAPLVIDEAVVAELVDGDADPDAPTPFLLLAPFGECAVEVLFEELAEEEDRGRRAALLGLLRQLAPGRAEPVVRRLEDTRWYVVRNAVNVLRYSRHPRSLDLLAQAARHAAEGVRREAVFGLAAGGEAAAPYLGVLAVSPDASVRLLAIQALSGLTGPAAATALSAAVTGSRDVETRRRALDALAIHPSEEAASALRAFSRRSRPRLPRSLRRRARALVRGRSGDTR